MLVAGETEQLMDFFEGDWQKDAKFTLFKFPSLKHLKEFWHSEEYQAIKHLRTENTPPNFTFAVNAVDFSKWEVVLLSMRELYPDLCQLSQDQMFGMAGHGYLLTQPEGNVLFYNPHGSSDIDVITQMGGLTHHYLSCSHEINENLSDVKQELGSQLYCYRNVEPYFTKFFSADQNFNFSETQLDSTGVEIIYTPGHTNNNLCIRYTAPHGIAYVFTGDTIY